jgi:hypothetical protein
VYEWIEMFKNGRTSVTGSERMGCPSTVASDDKREQARAMIIMERRLTITDIAATIHISEGSAHYCMTFLDSTKFVHNVFQGN